MAEEKQTISPALSGAPHIRSDQSVAFIMWVVVLALAPAAAYSVFLFGTHALLVMLCSVGAAVAAEAAYRYALRKNFASLDGSAAITGLLLAMCMPPQAPVWLAVTGSVFAVIVAKQVFGGLGFNIFNPALAGRVFLLGVWPVYMTASWHSFGDGNVLADGVMNAAGLSGEAFDAITMATPLAALKEMPGVFTGMNVPLDGLYATLFSNDMLLSQFLGNTGGCIGETSAVLLLAGGLFLLYKRIITWHIPFAFIATVAAFMGIYFAAGAFPYVGRAVLYHLLSGGLFLGAIFMATDTVTSPITAKGKVLMGIGCGVITCVIRLWSGFPEGVSFSILAMNALVPLIDRYTRPRVFGTSK
ncbi:MAG: RnfABCDGE type electron transport complex subunit D [Spirochaetes bacterium]|nr:MAG: RnfABCDGE type electron transport complex subunit D [Spirochaetota bacterium]